MGRAETWRQEEESSEDRTHVDFDRISIRKRKSEGRYVVRVKVKEKIIESDRRCRVKGEGVRRRERKQRTKKEEEERP